MFNKYWKKLSIGICLLALVFVTGLNIEKNQTRAEQLKTVNEIFEMVGPFIKNHPELLSASLKSIEDYNTISNDDWVAKVNNILISIAEIKFRKGLKDAAGEQNSTYQSVFNILVEEKVVLDYAIKNNLIPSKNELNEFIASEKALYESDMENQKLINIFCEKASMSLDEYWDTYEKYNAFRMILLKKSFDHAISQAISNKQLIIDNIDEIERAKLEKSYWNSFKKELKRQANIKINENYDYLKLSVDTK